MTDGFLLDVQQEVATLEIAGQRVFIRGLSCLTSTQQPDLIFVLHGRTQQASDVDVLASIISAQNHGALVVSLDHRNHGHRLLSDVANGTWADGNTTHAQDMVSILYGTSRDVSELITLLPMFLHRTKTIEFNRIFCVGVSLGGHSTYIALSADPRIYAGVSIIGCPDMPLLLASRAGDNTQQLVPPSFVDVCRKIGATVEQVSRKHLLVLKGNEDILVPWTASEEFIQRLPRDRVTVRGYDGVGHAVTGDMVADAAEWIRQIRADV